MTSFTEDDLQVTFNDVVQARRFDDIGHGLSHCMKAVDFIVELHDRYLFIEFKDPDNPNIPAQHRAAAIENLQSSAFDEDLKYKSGTLLSTSGQQAAWTSLLITLCL